jgi:1,4-alpha-glucan branching enzyme
MSLKKKFDEKKPVCKVTFVLSNEITNSASRVNLAGDFNNWDIESIPMKKVNGAFSVSVNLKKGMEYQFKYLIDGKEWLNENEADKMVPNPFHTDNSVVVV